MAQWPAHRPICRLNRLMAGASRRDPTYFRLGVVYAEMLTGKRLFPGRSAESALAKVADGCDAVTLSRQGVSASRRALLSRLLAPAPADRFPSALVALEALRVSGRFRARLVLVGIAFLVGVALILAYVASTARSTKLPGFPPLDQAWSDKLANSTRAEQRELLRQELHAETLARSGTANCECPRTGCGRNFIPSATGSLT